MVGHHDRVHAVVGGAAGVLGGQHTLEDQRQPAAFTEPGEVGPGQSGVELLAGVLGDARTPLARTVTGGHQGRVEIDRADLRRDGEAIAQIAQSAADPGGVDGEQQGRVAGRLGAFHQGGEGLPAAQPVELEPERAGGGLGDVLQGAAGEDSGDEQRAGLSRRPSGRRFPVRMDQPVVGHRGNSDRELQCGAQQIDGRGALGDVDERARAERMASEHFPVRRQGAFRTTAAFDEVPDFRGKLIARRAFDPGQREWCHGRPRSRTGYVRTGPRIGSVGGLDLIGIDLDLTNRLCNRLATELDVLPGVDDDPGK